eukprot:scaffold24739_cov97-Isochrysis_galbana.AAC.2
MKGRAPGGKVKGRGERGGNASLPGDSRVSRRVRPLALLIFKNFFYSGSPTSYSGAENTEELSTPKSHPEEPLGRPNSIAIQCFH